MRDNVVLPSGDHISVDKIWSGSFYLKESSPSTKGVMFSVAPSAHAGVLYLFPIIKESRSTRSLALPQLRAAVDGINPDCIAGTGIADDRNIIVYTCL